MHRISGACTARLTALRALAASGLPLRRALLTRAALPAVSQHARPDDLRHEETACRSYCCSHIPLRCPPASHHPAQRACSRPLPPASTSFRAHCPPHPLFSTSTNSHHTYGPAPLHLVHASCDVANGHSLLTTPATLSLTLLSKQYHPRAGHLTRPNYIHHGHHTHIRLTRIHLSQTQHPHSLGPSDTTPSSTSRLDALATEPPSAHPRPLDAQ